jgi:hypothetical protein
MRDRIQSWLLWILIVLHAAIAFPLAYYLNIWDDEASTLHTTQNGLKIAFQGLFTDEKQAPLYFLVLSVWRSLDHSIFFARAFSVICSLAAIAVFWHLAQKIWTGRTSLVVATLFALHPYLLWASLEIRLYSLIILLTCLFLTFFIDGFLAADLGADVQKDQRRARIYYAITAVAGIYTNYYLGFPLVGAFVALLLLRRWKQAGTYLFFMFGVGVAIVPLFYFLQMQFMERAAAYQEHRSVIEAIRIVWNHFLTFVLPTEIYTEDVATSISVARLWIVRFAIVAAIVLLVKKRFRPVDIFVIAFAAIASVSVGFFFFVYAELGSDYLQIRHASIFFVSVFVVVCLLADRLLPKLLKAPVTAMVLLFYAYSAFALYPTLTKRGDWKNVSDFISQQASPDRPAVVFPVYDTIALSQYFKGPGSVLPTEKAFDFFIEAQAGTPAAYAHQIDFVISSIPVNAREIWLLTSDKCANALTCQPLENYIESNYNVIEDKGFYKERVRLLRKKAQ